MTSWTRDCDNKNHVAWLGSRILTFKKKQLETTDIRTHDMDDRVDIDNVVDDTDVRQTFLSRVNNANRK